MHDGVIQDFKKEIKNVLGSLETKLLRSGAKPEQDLHLINYDLGKYAAYEDAVRILSEISEKHYEEDIDV